MGRYTILQVHRALLNSPCACRRASLCLGLDAVRTSDGHQDPAAAANASESSRSDGSTMLTSPTTALTAFGTFLIRAFSIGLCEALCGTSQYVTDAPLSRTGARSVAWESVACAAREVPRPSRCTRAHA